MKCLSEPMSIPNICFCGKIRKISMLGVLRVNIQQYFKLIKKKKNGLICKDVFLQSRSIDIFFYVSTKTYWVLIRSVSVRHF